MDKHVVSIYGKGMVARAEWTDRLIPGELVRGSCEQLCAKEEREKAMFLDIHRYAGRREGDHFADPASLLCR